MIKFLRQNAPTIVLFVLAVVFLVMAFRSPQTIDVQCANGTTIHARPPGKVVCR